MNGRPRIGITVGDPAGIGPEIARKAADDPGVRALCDVVFYGAASDTDVARFERGRVSAAAGLAAYDAILRAVEDAVQGRIDAIATAPINKEAFAAAGLPWRGHTDLLAHLTGAPRVAMMFYAESLRVILATVHIALAEVPRAITREGIEGIVELTAASLPRFGIASPRLALAGLNPHAGEHGVIGREDDEVLAPAVAACRARGITIDGPLPADTVFVRAMRGRVRRGRRVLSRPGADPDQARRVRPRRQRDAGPADRADVGRSRHRVRHRGTRHRGSIEPDRSGEARGAAHRRRGEELTGEREKGRLLFFLSRVTHDGLSEGWSHSVTFIRGRLFPAAGRAKRGLAGDGGGAPSQGD